MNAYREDWKEMAQKEELGTHDKATLSRYAREHGIDSQAVIIQALAQFAQALRSQPTFSRTATPKGRIIKGPWGR